METIIKRYNTISNNGLMRIVSEALHELHDAGLAGDAPSIHYTYDALAIYAVDAPLTVIKDKCGFPTYPVPLGIMVYKSHKDENFLFIHLSYIRPAVRRLGLYNKLWDYIKMIARLDGVDKIMSVTSPLNWTMQGVYEKQGRRVTQFTYEFILQTVTTQDQARIATRLAVMTAVDGTAKSDESDLPF